MLTLKLITKTLHVKLVYIIKICNLAQTIKKNAKQNFFYEYL